MTSAPTKQKPRRSYTTHKDHYRQRLLRERGTDAINGSTRSGKAAKSWRRSAIDKKGGKACPLHVKELIEHATFALWRALELRAFIVADARERGTPINKRVRRLPSINQQYDAAIEQWQKINDSLELDKGTDLARRLMEQSRLQEAAKSNGQAVRQ